MTYKLSLYNNIIRINNSHTILFNSYNMESILLKNCILEDGEELKRKMKSDKLLYNQLLETGMLVPEEKNEVEELELRIQSGQNNSDHFIFHINPTLDCNFNCWYCYENHISGSKMNPSVLSGVKKRISGILDSSNIKQLNISFFGGEPLMHFEEVAKEIITHTSKECESKSKSFRISFTTNGYLFNDSIIEWLSHFPCSFQITLDGGSLAHNKTRFLKGGEGSFDRIVENVYKLVEHHLHVIVRVNYTEGNIYTVGDIFESFKDLWKTYSEYVSFDFQRVWQERNNTEDETELKMMGIRKLFRESGATVHDNFLLRDVRFPCYGDKKNYLLVNYNGDVFKCTARDFLSKNRIGKLMESGEIEFDSELLKARNESKFSKKVCRDCRVAPLCGGACIQKAYELRHHEECTLGYTEEDKDNVIINILDWAITNDKVAEKN